MSIYNIPDNHLNLNRLNVISNIILLYNVDVVWNFTSGIALEKNIIYNNEILIITKFCIPNQKKVQELYRQDILISRDAPAPQNYKKYNRSYKLPRNNLGFKVLALEDSKIILFHEFIGNIIIYEEDCEIKFYRGCYEKI